MKKIRHFLIYSHDIRILFTAVVYFASAYLGLILAFKDPFTSPVWPPVGVGFAMILLLGPRVWPGIAIGSLLAYMLVFWLKQVEISIATIQASTIIAIGNTIELLAGYFLLKISTNNGDPFRKTSETFIFLLVALVMCLIGSSLGTYSLYLIGLIDRIEFLQTWFYWWIPDVASVLLFTPFILSWGRRFRIRTSRSSIFEFMLFSLCLIFFIVILDNYQLGSTLETSIPFLVIPFLLWLAFRFNLQTSMAGILIAALSAIYLTINEIGPFVLETNENSILILQIFIGVISISSIVLSSTVYERWVAQETIKRFNETLESKIEERTKELNAEIIFRKNAEDKIKVANEQLHKTNIELDNFVYKVSHDLRAPIASVLGLVNLAKKENKVDVLREYFNMIEKSAEQQDVFIKDILDLSRNSRLVVNKDKIQWEELLNDTFDNLKYSVKDKRIERIINIHGKSSFYSDQRRIKVIFNNLISNSIRYANGKDPKVEIDISVNKTEAAIKIADNGIGIEKPHQKKVFEMFYRAAESNVGSGLGLYIVKESIDRLNGHIELLSEKGEGTVFNISIPNLKYQN
jgi:signal transduction histidine kinase